MKEYVQISPAEKLKLLNEHSIGTTWKSLEDTKWCLHCEAQFTGRSVRVYEDDGVWLECGTPDCDGSPIDWADYPWWDENHPETKAHDEAMEKLDDIDEAGNPERN
jgi:hypothetical protein